MFCNDASFDLFGLAFPRLVNVCYQLKLFHISLKFFLKCCSNINEQSFYFFALFCIPIEILNYIFYEVPDFYSLSILFMLI